MAITVQQAIDRAVERSNLNDADLIPEDELVAYVSQYERGVYLTAAQLNPDYFGQEGLTATRGSATSSWDLNTTPGNVAVVSEIEVYSLTGTVSGLSQGTKVNLISRREPDVEISPRAYVRGRKVYEYNEELQTDSSNYVTRLYVYYSFLPPERTSVSNTLSLPSEFSDLVILPLARTLALRDQRPDEVAPIDSEYIMSFQRFANALGVFDEGVIRSLASVPASAAPAGVSGGE